MIPDVMMRPQPGGGWVIELNNETLPRVLVNNQYYARVSRTIRKREDKQYVNECLQSANWLVKSLHQRATTILKVATEIVRQQQDYARVAAVERLAVGGQHNGALRGNRGFEFNGLHVKTPLLP